ncbi:hypothetical protein BsWGS_20486 [Bradybaena similaris]
MWFYRRMLEIHWTAQMRNLNIFKETKTQKQLITSSERDSRYFFLTTLSEEKSDIVWQLELFVESDRGRQQEKILDCPLSCKDVSRCYKLLIARCEKACSPKPVRCWRSQDVEIAGCGDRSMCVFSQAS